MQSIRERLLGTLDSDPSTFRERAVRIDGHRTAGTGAVPAFDSVDGSGVPGWADLLERERRLVWRVWVLADAPLGVTLSGAAYEDNPLWYANRTFRRLTGYTMAELYDRNPRLLQGPDTEAEAVASLHAGLRGWEPVTADLWNYRRDGTRFRNRVSLLPVFDETGTVTHWFGVQGRLEREG
ncbi:PAS domain-containing protein [Salinirubellus salinus]|uniref:PAS domain-containing protein n=1 Tax=Salinirubellus salinus TaxID=1364945 RepID=A0A9E7U9X5_9EURY|nr:PAS domain-containing protein [Salinirubellus salinus]UWM53299.1 PAS domain-containing protein [Salinirubellus salinus]